MFRTAELGQKVSKKEWSRIVPVLREQLLDVQARLRETDVPVLLVFAGVDGAGKGETANLLNEWMDPRGTETHAYDDPTPEEAERPEFWRYWRDLPPRGRIGIFLSAWYSRPLLDRAYGRTTLEELDDQLDRIAAFEKNLADDGALVLKFWMHLGKEQQEERFKSLELDPLHEWRVSPKDWEHWEMYDQFVLAAERIIMRTSRGDAPWHIVEGAETRFRSLRVATVLREEIERRLRERESHRAALASGDAAVSADSASNGRDETAVQSETILSSLDLTVSMDKDEYADRLSTLQARLNLLHRVARSHHRSVVLVFEGWDAAGKGGAIRRIVPALDARAYQIVSIGAPTDEERARHYLWRFWRHLNRAGRVLIFDRSWYGRVLVERVEDFASEADWRRAYAEINDFEDQLVQHGIVLVKIWIHISPDEQERRFRAREEVPYKRWKLTDEDWRNRSKWAEYEQAVNDMVQHTSTSRAPWTLVEGEDKRYARIRTLETVCDALESALEEDRDRAEIDAAE